MKTRTRVRKWALYAILVPLFPMLFAAILRVALGIGLDHHGLFGGSELYILSVTILASTKNDLDSSDADFSQFRVYNVLTELLLISLILNVMMFASVYINEHIGDYGLPKPFIADFGLVLGILATIICLSLQAILHIAERVEERSDT